MIAYSAPVRRTTLHSRCAALGLLLVACSAPSDDSDGGTPDSGADGGGQTPSFVVGPQITQALAEALIVDFTTDVPVTATLQWRGAGVTGSEVSATLAISHSVRLEGLPPGRTIEVAVAAVAADGLSVVERVTGRTTVRVGPRHRVLFDAAHGQQAGNADWIVDTSGRFPSPAAPVDEADWIGAYSAFGVELVRSARFDVEVLEAPARFEHGAGSAQDLTGYDVVVIPEPNTQLSVSEQDALDDFVRAGGGLLLIANHGGSDRDNDGFDSVTVLNQFLDPRGYGVRFAGDRRDGPASRAADDPLTDGPFGPVTVLGAFDGTTLVLDTIANPSLTEVAWIPGFGSFVARSEIGSGRIVLHGDSAAADDGTDSGGNLNIIDAWGDPSQDNRAFFLNCVSWLAREY